MAGSWSRQVTSSVSGGEFLNVDYQTQLHQLHFRSRRPAYTGVGRAASLGLPVGLQLYSVRTLLPTDYAGTLKQIGALGYKEVEAAGFFNLPVEQVKAAMQAAGLRCVSAHYPSGAAQATPR